MAMGMAVFPSLLTSLFLISSLIFFLLHHHSPTPQIPPPPLHHHRSLLNTSLPNGDFSYPSLHFHLFHQNPHLSIPSLSLILLLQFYILVKTAQDRFSIVVTTLSSHFNLSPSMAAVTLLALGNGAPDVFASAAAMRAGQPRTGLGAIISAGMFVSGLVVGVVGIYAAPFAVDPAPFVRDVLFYLVGVLWLFYVYLSGEIFVWQAAGFVGFYVFFVGFVFWMDVGGGEGRQGDSGKVNVEMVGLVANSCKGLKVGDIEIGGQLGSMDDEKKRNGFAITIQKLLTATSSSLTQVSKVWEVPVSILLELTIPRTAPSEWNRFYLSANIALCPLALLYSCKSFIPLDHKIVFLLPHSHFPLWSVVLFASTSLALLHYIVEREPPEREQLPVVLVAFVMSVFWISTVAGELLNCLAAIGTILDLPPAFLGLTVLAWGNSIGDLVADVAVAKAGQPAMAMAGCFACPMFNMLVGLGTALVSQTLNAYPSAYELQFHASIVVAFVFLLLSLMGSLLVLTWSRFRVPRFWGFCLVGLYAVFMAVSVVIAKFSR